MSSGPLSQQYSELISLTKLYLMQEFSRDSLIEACPENYNFFRQEAMKQKQASQPVKQDQPVPQQTGIPKLPPQTAEKKAVYCPPTTTKPSPPQSSQTAQQTIEVKPTAPSSDVAAPAKKSGNFINLEPVTSPAVHDLSDIRKIMQEKFPQHQLIQEPLIIQNEACILSKDESPIGQALLINLAKAITLSGHQTEYLVNIRPDSLKMLLSTPGLRLVIAAKPFLEVFPHLNSDCQGLGLKLLPLADLSSYLEKPLLKASLWKSLCEILNNP